MPILNHKHKFQLLPLLIAALLVPCVRANQRAYGWCEQGGHSISVPGSLPSNTPIQQSYPSCIVSVYVSGSLTLATIYADTNNTPKTNPFTADSTGYYFFYAANGRYDISLGGPAATLGDVLLYDASSAGVGPGGTQYSTQYNFSGGFNGAQNATATTEFLSQVSAGPPQYLSLISAYLSDWFTPTSSIIASFPLATSSASKVVVATDGSTASDCTVGSGSNLVWCRSNGSVWASVGGGSGGGGGTGTVTGVTASSPLASSGSSVTPNVTCATCAVGSSFTSNALMLGGGGQAIAPLGSSGTTTTLLHGNASGAPTYALVNLATDVTGILPIAVLSNSSLTVTAGSGLSGGGSVSLGGTTTLTANVGSSAGTVAAGNDTRFGDASSLLTRPILAGVPLDGQVYLWVAANSDWELATPPGGGGGATPPGGGANSIQYNNTTFAGVVNASATKGYLTQTNSGTPAFQLAPLPGADLSPINLASSSNGGVTGLLPSGNLPATVVYNNQSNILVNRAAPSTPAAGNVTIWSDSTNKVLSAKNDAGTTSITVAPNAGSANQWVSALTAGGVLSLTQPAATNLSDSAAVARRAIVSGLPAAAGESGKTWWVTDGASTSDCTTGSGTWAVPCKSNGSVWAALNVGVSGNVGVQNNAGSTVGTQPAIQFLSGASNYITWTLTNGSGVVTILPVLSASVARLDTIQTWTAGIKQSFSSTATTAPMKFTGAALPNTPVSGDWAFDSTVTPNWYDGSAFRKAAYSSTTLTSGLPLIGCGTNCINIGTVTGTGSLFVLNSSPTIITPTIASFANSNHNHTNSAGGGQLSTLAFSSSILTGTGLKLVTGTGSYTVGDCLQVGAGLDIIDASAPCPSAAWANVLAGTNTHALVMGSGGTFTASGTGTIVGTSLNGTGALSILGGVGSAPTVSAGQIGCWYDSIDTTQHCKDAAGSGTVMTRGLSTPASSSATCTVPQISYDANFFYLCTATNTWKRAALTAF